MYVHYRDIGKIQAFIIPGCHGKILLRLCLGKINVYYTDNIPCLV